MAIDPADQKFFPDGGSTSTGGGGLTVEEQILQAILEQNKEADEPDSFNEDDFWQNAVIGKVESDIKAVAKKYEMDLDFLLGWFDGQKDNLINYLDNKVVNSGRIEGADPQRPFRVGASPMDPEGMQVLFDAAQLWIGQYFPGFRDAITAELPSTSGRRGRGSGRPTAAEIRAQFDMDALIEAVNQMSRGLILTEFDSARAVAKSYVDAIVANPEQKLDFETFARARILNSPRAKVIYKDKPEALSHEQFLQPYVQAASQMIGPGHGNQLANIATGGARLGADPNAFRARLQRTRQVQSSTPFLSKLGDRVSGLKQVLR